MQAQTLSPTLDKPRTETAVTRLAWPGGALLLIAALALGLRVWGLGFGLPSLYHPDEPIYVQIAQDMFKTGDLNPHFFNYPSLFFYINALAYIPYFLVGKLLGVFGSPLDIPYPVTHSLGVGSTTLPSTFLMGRGISVLFGVGAIVLVYFVGRALFKSPLVGLLAALMTAVSPASVAHSRFITPNMMLNFFGLVALLGAALVLQRGWTRDYILAGLAVGLTAATKYNGALIIVAPAAAHFLRWGQRGLKDWRIYLAPLLAAAVFLLTTPYALLDSAKFLHDMSQEAQHYATAHFGMEGDALNWYAGYLWSVEGLVVLLALLEMVRGLAARSKPTIMLLIFPVIYFIFISAFVVRNDRTVLPLLPSLALLAASFVNSIVGWRWSTPLFSCTRRGMLILAAGLAALAVVYPLQQTVARSQESQAGVASRNAAQSWINSALPPGSRIAVEAYGPVIDDKRFSVEWAGRLADHTADWYDEQGFEYLVFSGGIFNRFYREPDRYAGDVQQYDALFRSLELVHTFPDSLYEIRVYRVKGGGQAP